MRGLLQNVLVATPCFLRQCSLKYTAWLNLDTGSNLLGLSYSKYQTFSSLFLLRGLIFYQIRYPSVSFLRQVIFAPHTGSLHFFFLNCLLKHLKVFPYSFHFSHYFKTYNHGCSGTGTHGNNVSMLFVLLDWKMLISTVCFPILIVRFHTSCFSSTSLLTTDLNEVKFMREPRKWVPLPDHSNKIDAEVQFGPYNKLAHNPTAKT